MRIIAAVATLLAVTLICAFRALPSYQALGSTLSLSDSTPARVYEAALDIRRAVPHGTIVTLAPVFGLEAGLYIYPSLASGPFAPRVADLLPPDTKASQRISSIADLVAAMQARPPEAVLVGTEGALEDPLAQFAARHDYRKIALPSGLTLWVRRGGGRARGRARRRVSRRRGGRLSRKSPRSRLAIPEPIPEALAKPCSGTSSGLTLQGCPGLRR